MAAAIMHDWSVVRDLNNYDTECHLYIHDVIEQVFTFE